MPVRDHLQGAATYTHLGMTLAIAVLGFFFLGHWLDGKIGTDPWLAVTGALLGAAGGFINLVKTLTNLQEEQGAGSPDKDENI